MGKVVYEITAEVRSDLAAAYESYMTATHIADVLATGCFESAEMSRSGRSYRIRYVARTRDDLDRYLTEHIERLRMDFTDRFPQGVSLRREIWEIVHTAGQKEF